MNKVMLILMLVVCLAGCKKEPSCRHIMLLGSCIRCDKPNPESSLEAITGEAMDKAFAGMDNDASEGTYVVMSAYNGTPIENVISKETGRNVNYEWEEATGALEFIFETGTGANLLFNDALMADFTILEEPNYLITVRDWTGGCDISITLDSGEMLFTTTDGKFDVIYDPNECTANAAAFAKCMETMMPGYILSVAEKLTGVKEND